MNRDLLDQIVNATLYEGYILYPYRASSKKNRRERFTFGRVYPEAYSLAQKGSEPCSIQSECLVHASGPDSAVSVSVRFLHPVMREIGVLPTPMVCWTGEEVKYHTVPELRIGDEEFLTWHEAIEREVGLDPIALRAENMCSRPFQFPASRHLEPLRDGELIVGLAVRHYATLQGTVNVAVHSVGGDFYKVSVRVLNYSPLQTSEMQDSERVLLRLFASTHVVLTARDAEFVSQIDPPDELKAARASCQNQGVWPVLVGDEDKGERDTMFASPIILYDYPKIAPESAGSLFDGTEIDEILTLRILSMTDEEKLEMRRVDEQARRMLERTETLSNSALLGMHGVMRKTHPDRVEPVDFDDFFGASVKLEGVLAGGVFLQPGDRVRVRPKGRADIIDTAIAGQTAIVEAVEQDLEHHIHVAVVLEEDPGKDLGFMRQPGHRFFYSLDEVEPIGKGSE